ncbi:MAG: hypothetical protein QOI95_3089 [Acidimicrobiaceae bacterium]
MLASLKYDEYGGYRPGVKFAENLARWLEQFDSAEREVAYAFVRERLVFVSDAEMSHLIDIAYPDELEPRLLTRSASDSGVARHRVAAIADSVDFRSLRRRTLFLGLSDGAQLDRLRRASQLSHEQFSQDYLIDAEQAARLQAELAAVLTDQKLPGESAFRQIFLVDDFSGSGRTLIREDDDNIGEYKGKLTRFRDRLADLQATGVVANDHEVGILLYVASQQAVEHVVDSLARVGLGGWTVDVVQLLGRHIKVDQTDPPTADLCHAYYDPSSADKHKADTPIGYSDCALPLVLSHNTPNNSICLLWAESSEDDGLGRKALFPRYERHHKDRP